ncbi:MAG TPA: 2-dehydro-3-deoxy-D-gluconate 5-dehydrogenase KduD [Vicinamibacterales bacterium]|jgi:2-deoxy-D-gluconate 3-dehydrogenase
MTLDVFSLDGKVALVTGASRGLGAGMAAALSAAGAAVALHSNEKPATETADRICRESGRRTALFTADLANRAAADRLIADTIATFGQVDILVNNAGIIRRKAAAQHTDEDWDAVIEVNLSNAFRLCRAMGKHLLETGRPGKIINVASLLSFQGGITVPGYAAAKGGMVQLTKALANEWASHGINVNAIAPGYMQTDNTRALREDPQRNKQITERIPAGRWGTPEDMAGAAVFLASNASDYVHGHVLVVDGGWMGR